MKPSLPFISSPEAQPQAVVYEAQAHRLQELGNAALLVDQAMPQLAGESVEG